MSGRPLRMSLTRRAMREPTWRWQDRRVLALLDQVVVSAGTFLTTLVAARSLDTAAFSALSLTLLVSLLLANLHRAIITQPLNVLGATDEPVGPHGRVDDTLALNATLAAAALAIFAILGQVVGLASNDVLLGWLAFVGFSYQDTLRRYAYNLGDLALALRLSAGTQLLLFAFLALALASGLRGTWVFLLALFASASLAAAWGMRHLRVRVGWTWQATRRTWQTHWPIARWLVLTVAAIWGASQVYLLLAASLGALAVAHLAAARNILNGLGLFTQTIANYAPSRVTAHLESGGMAAVRPLLKKYMVWAATGTLAFLLLTATLGEALLELLYGPSFRAAAPWLTVMAIGYVMMLWGTVFGSFCLGLGDSRSGFLSHVLATLFTLSAGIWLSSRFGLAGLVGGLVTSLSIAALAQGGFLFWRMRRLAALRPSAGWQRPAPHAADTRAAHE